MPPISLPISPHALNKDTSRRIYAPARTRARSMMTPLAAYSFACIDPEAACVNDDDITVDMFENCGYLLGIGNGNCDDDNNTEECGTFPLLSYVRHATLVPEALERLSIAPQTHTHIMQNSERVALDGEVT